MLWKPLVAAALFLLAAPAFADEKGDALVYGWIGRIPDILPLTAETTTTYSLGKRTATYKHKFTRAQIRSASASAPYRFDDGFPFGLFNDPLGDNFDPLSNPDAFAEQTKYLGKETVDGMEYDVVEVRERLPLRNSPPSPMLISLPSKVDNRNAIKWYLDSEGIVRRMTFAAEVQVPNSTVSIGAAFDAPAPASPDKPQASPKAQPPTTETFSAVMVVDSLRKTRKPLVRPGLSEPLYTVPESSRGACVFSPDGRLLAICRQDRLQVILTSTGQPKYSLDNVKGLGRLDFSLDGKSLAFTDAAGVTVVRADDGTPIRTLAAPKFFSSFVRLSPDGKRIALVGKQNLVEIWSVETGLLERTLKESGRSYEAMFTADGRRLVSVGTKTGILVWDTATWEITAHLPIRAFSREAVALSPDGKHIAAVNADNVVLLWDGSGSAPVRTLTGSGGRVRFLTFSSDGARLYAGDSDELSDLPTGAPGYVAWDVDSGKLVADGALRRRTLSFGQDHGVVSPDGRFAAFPGQSSSGSVTVFPLRAEK